MEEKLWEPHLFCQALAADPNMTEEEYWKRLDEPDPKFPESDLPRIFSLKDMEDALIVIRAREFSRLDLSQSGRQTNEKRREG